MARYNFKVHSFQAPLPEKLKIDPAFYLKERQVEVNRFRRELRRQEELLKQSRRKLKSRLQNLKNEFQSKMSDLSLNRKDKRENLSKEADRLEEEYFKKRFELEKKINQAGSKHQSWRLSHLKKNYVDEKTRRFILTEISAEVQAVSRQVCDRHGVDLLLDQGPRPRGSDFETKGVDPSKAGNYKNHLADFLKRPLKIGEGNAKLSIRGQFKRLAPHFSQYSKMNLLLGEGHSPALKKDLTLAILEEIWTRNQIPKEVQQALRLAITAWRKGDQS